MPFFWKQPEYQSDLDQFLKKLIKENSSLAFQKKSSFKRFWDQDPLDIENAIRKKQSLLKYKANRYL